MMPYLKVPTFLLVARELVASMVYIVLITNIYILIPSCPSHFIRCHYCGKCASGCNPFLWRSVRVCNDIYLFLLFWVWYQGLTTIYPLPLLSPVCTLEKYSDFKDVIKQINSSRFGLQGGLFTQSFDRAFYGYEHLEMGGVVINDVPSVRVESQPVRSSTYLCICSSF